MRYSLEISDDTHNNSSNNLIIEHLDKNVIRKKYLTEFQLSDWVLKKNL